MNNPKETLREQAKKIRETLDIKQCSKKLVKKIREFKIYQNAKQQQRSNSLHRRINPN